VTLARYLSPNMEGLVTDVSRRFKVQQKLCIQLVQKYNQSSLFYRWRNLQGVLHNYRNGLGSALEIHAFYRDVGETKERIREKMLALSVEDTGHDLLQVEALQRRQETLERDISVIGSRIKVINETTNLNLGQPPVLLREHQLLICE
jgi:hypothetical protein